MIGIGKIIFKAEQTRTDTPFLKSSANVKKAVRSCEKREGNELFLARFHPLISVSVIQSSVTSTTP